MPAPALEKEAPGLAARARRADALRPEPATGRDFKGGRGGAARRDGRVDRRREDPGARASSRRAAGRGARARADAPGAGAGRVQDADARLATLAIVAEIAASRPPSAARRSAASRVAEAERLKAIDVLELRNRLAAFALHCDHETRGAARLRRLTPRDAQYARREPRRRTRGAASSRAAGPSRGWTSSTSSRSRTGACWTRSSARWRGGRRRGATRRKKRSRVYFATCPRRAWNGWCSTGCGATRRRWSGRSSTTRGSRTSRGRRARRRASPGAGGTVERKPTEVKAARGARRGVPRVSARLLAVLDARERARRRAERW